MSRRAQWPAPPLAGEQALWCAWFEQLGISPRDVAVPGWVEVDDAAGTVIFLGIVQDEQGRPVISGDEVVKRAMRVRVDVPPPPRQFPTLSQDRSGFGPDDVVDYRRRE